MAFNSSNQYFSRMVHTTQAKLNLYSDYKKNVLNTHEQIEEQNKTHSIKNILIHTVVQTGMKSKNPPNQIK